MKTNKDKVLTVIGSRDKIDFPDLDITNLPCKIDTGAQSSAIHCERVRIKEIDGQEVLSVRFLSKTVGQYRRKEFTFTHFKEKKIKNSFGDTEYRYLIPLKVVLFGQTIETEFSLANRAQMQYKVLIGRKLLFKNFVVDVSKKNLSFNKKPTT
jgi:hypothetical protein